MRTCFHYFIYRGAKPDDYENRWNPTTFLHDIDSPSPWKTLFKATFRARSAAPFSKTAPAKISATVFKHAIFKNPTFCTDVTWLSRRLWQIKLTLKVFQCFMRSPMPPSLFLYLIIVVHIDNMLSLLSPTL
jgi:hypothetical protein